MSKTVDERVVEMRFDNQQFERNAQTSMSTLDKLKQSLKLTEASKGFQDVDSAVKRVDMSGLGNAVESVKARFSALQVMGVTALANITNSAVNTGKRIASALTIEPIKAGFNEYETQMNAVQTILANTQKEGTNVKIVNKALDELNTYADKTIYNFTEMTRNIGTFTAAGVKLNTSVSAIKGIANLAAVSGSSSQQASTAMYQLSQAIASGTVKLMDWNSVVNAGMGGQVFQDALVRTAEHLGTGAKAAIKAEGSFRESLKTGWLTVDVLTQTLDQFSTAADTQKEYEAAVKKFIDQGYSKEEAKQMADMAKTAGEAATKVKTFTQLIDTLKEALGSGWTTSWRIIVGDFEEAKSLWTDVSDYFSEAINKSSQARNKLLQGWADSSGRTMAIEGLKNAFDGLLSIIKPIKEAFREVFPPATAKQLLSITENFKKLTEKFKIGSETADKLKRTFKGAFSMLDAGRKIVMAFIKPFASLLGSNGFSGIIDFILSITASIGDFLTALNEGTGAGKFISTISETLSKTFGDISNILQSATKGIKKFGDVFSKICSGITKFAIKVKNVVADAFGWISEHVSMGDIFAGLASGGLVVTVKKITELINTIKDAINSISGKGKKNLDTGIAKQFKDILNELHNSLMSFTTGIKVSSLITIAIAIGILSASLKTISQIKVDDIAKSIAAIGFMMTELSWTLKSVTKTIKANGTKGVVKAAFALLLIARAIKIMAGAIEQLSKLSLREIGRGLVGVGGGLGELCAAIKIINKTKISLRTSVSLLALAYSCKILGDALQKFAKLSWSEIGRGLTAMGGALTELVASVSVLGKFAKGKSILGSISIFILVKSLKDLSEGLASFADMEWDEIGRGLSAMGGALVEVGGVVAALGKIAGFSSLFAAGSIDIVINGLDDLAESLASFSDMEWDEIGRGLTAMGGALLEVAGISGALGKIVGFSGIIGAGTILIVIKGLNELADALVKFESMSWPEIGRGLTAMGGALLEVAGLSGALGEIVGFSGIFGAGTIWIVIQGLNDLADDLIKFGSMSWSEVGRGLTAMGGALLEVGGISGALGALVGIAGVFGAGTIWVATQGLDDLANALIKFGSMSWDEIGRGLTAMGGALLEVGGISGALGALVGVAGIFGAGTIWIAVQGLSDLADALAKFGSMSWDEIGRGLTAMLGALAEIAYGSFANMLSGLGALSIAKIAKPLGDLAESVKKWSGVTVPENIGKQLSELASGVRSFTFTNLGGSGLSKSAAPLGVLADSVKKWSGVTVPEGLDGQLTKLANGIKSFSFAFAGGWSISALVGPLGNLVDPVLKWKGVTIPATLGTDLSALAAGVKSFSFAFAGGWSISAIIGPLGDLSESVKKWVGISIPAGIKDNLTNISNGIKEFSLLDAAKLSMIDEPMNTLGNALKNIGSVQGTGENLVTFSNNIKTCIGNLTGNIISIYTVSKTISKLVDIVKNVNGTNVSNVLAFVNAANSLNNIKVGKITVDTKELSSTVSAIRNTMNSMNEEIVSKKSSLEVAMRTAVSGLNKAALSKKSDLISSGKELGKAIADGIKEKQSSVKSAGKTVASDGAAGAKDKRSSFVSAGRNLGEGLVEGINSKQQAAYNAGYALGRKAVQGEKDGQQSRSPSKLTIKAGKWLGEGLIIGMRRMSNLVYNSGYDLGKTAVDSMSSTIAHISDIFDSGIDAQPTIRPVVDLSSVESGAKSIGKMLNMDPSIGITSNISSINSMMNRRQNGSDDVVNAIKDLSNKIDNRPGDTYNFGDFTYSDGSEVSEAIQTLVRAARIERRN